jgi:Xaa-Pro dipeptidase
MRAAAEFARPGLTEARIAARISEAMIGAGSDYPGPVYVSSGPANMAAHEPWSDRSLDERDHLHSQLAAGRHRYTTTLVRPVIPHSGAAVVPAVADGARAALAAAEAAVRPGMTGDGVATLLTETFQEASGVPPAFDMLGYSVGITSRRA